MTLNLLVTGAVLACFDWMLIMHRRRPERPLSRAALLLMLVVEAPLLFAPFVPLSHILFEITTPLLQAATLVLAAMLWLAGLWLLRHFVTGSRDPREVWLAAIVFTCASVWVALAATISDYESGPTPSVTDEPIYILHLVTLYLAAACQIGLILLQSRRARQRNANA